MSRRSRRATLGAGRIGSTVGTRIIQTTKKTPSPADDPVDRIPQIGPAGVQVGMIRMESLSLGVGLDVLIGESPFIPLGYNGYQTVARPRKVAITEIVGWDPFRQTGSVVISGYRSAKSIAADFLAIEQMAGRFNGEKRKEIVIQIAGAGLFHTDLDYVIEDLSWNPDDMEWVGGTLVHASASITFMEWNPDDRLQPDPNPVEKRNATVNKREGSPYTVKEGDTLSKIAARKLGKAKRWREIADLNDIRDPRSIKPGQILRMPNK